MSNSWTFTTFENGKPVGTHTGLSHEDTVETISRAMSSGFDVEAELAGAEKRIAAHRAEQDSSVGVAA